MYKLMIVDDEATIRRSLEFALEDDYNIFSCDNKNDVLHLLRKENIDIILLDLRLGTEDGLEILKEIKKIKKETIVIIMTAYGTIESSVQAMKLGAFYYVTKPINIEELSLFLSKVNEYINLNSQIKYLSSQIEVSNYRYDIIGNSKKMNKIFELIDRVKDIDVNVLITGESGTGKDLVAKAIHFNGNRKEGPFNAINCSAIPSNLLESELFGHKKGAFTGAVEDKKGIIELSQKGTLFLDEIGDMDINLQTKLLRVLQDKEIRPIGSSSSINVDFRFIAATNKNLIEEIEKNNFRQDLFYRINVINIELPPLRQRKDDIPKLIEYFIKKYKLKLEKDIKGITVDALDSLEKYKYHGNVRELQNIIERAIVLTEDNYIKKEDLSEEIFQNRNIDREKDDLIPIYIGEDFKTIEKKVIEYNLKHFHGNRRKTAEILKIGERTLRYKIKGYNIN
ncbi:sigma-54-dependent Fis family transcriptional regulator [Clostridium tetani]|uniref:Stage 0 sporulation protein A homolog n=1 Tax=Clostridium tetani TaxID=1513 RepID=A0ABC8EEP4_CLOTA|nr:sigma-54 dependent transcriptional regulator [Clostridium tetani]AVP53910.1 sigma-54-dependent Fis family transcriptional regulator [Clostridium tetani]RXI73588.1 sigma-54-dependent Fis family transcriptional regulator [Clostridium tetani]RXI77716.1 sigma-54-dependent Fis family transcriptional regulator [Clostridium tetani]WFN61587.1 sigma-54 dependent transcriptional regulator [Clostridium tetani]SUY57448.1 transcriptional response regulator [Clostridium tetani]